VDTRTKIRWIFVALIGVFLIIAGVDDDNYGTSYVGAGILFLAVLGAWWHSELLRLSARLPRTASTLERLHRKMFFVTQEALRIQDGPNGCLV
jgi:hypothetical protein